MRKIVFLPLLMFFVISCISSSHGGKVKELFIAFECTPGEIAMYWRDTLGSPLGSLGNLKSMVESKGGQLKFAMNGGMYLVDQSPQGLYIENGKLLNEVNLKKGSTNFYWQPNGVFYVNAMNQAIVCKTENFIDTSGVKYATQSGPMLVFDGNIHPGFKEGSEHVNIRNGVGILPSGNVIMAISTEKVTLYDFANFFKEKGCQNALYLDGFVSKMYCPEKGMEELGGSFGVLVGVEK